MATKKPINNFKDIYTNYSIFLNSYVNKHPKTQVLDILNNIDDFIDKMLEVYSINLGGPMKEYPI